LTLRTLPWPAILLGAVVLAWVALRDWDEAADVDLASYDFTPNSRGRFFLLQKEGAGDIYLFGTFHSNDPRVLELPSQVAEALALAEVVATESRRVPFEPDSSSTDAVGYALPLDEMRELCVLPAEESASAILGAPLFDALARAVSPPGTLRPFPLDQLDRIRPYCVISYLGMPRSELQRGTLILDDALLHQAIEQGKTVVRLESFRDQYQFTLSMPAQFQAEEVELTLETLATDRLELTWNADIESYLDGENDNILRWLEPFSDAYRDFLVREAIVARNRRMAEAILDLSDGRTIFVATGAGHLPGEEGIVNLLARESYSVTVLEPPP
jgi:hypothetical protein